MKKIITVIMSTFLLIFTLVGCSSNNEDVKLEEERKQQEEMEISRYNEEEKKYGPMLTSGKTYEEMEPSDRTKFAEVCDGFDNFTNTFKEKYKSKVEEIDITRKEAVEKWKSEEEAKKQKEIQSRENIVGKSDKNFDLIDKATPRAVRNDVTGNWRYIGISTTEDILKYIKSYAQKNIKSTDEVHAIVNFAFKTTTNVSKLTDNIISVTVHEYVKGEEHDAKKMFSGMVLGEYFVYMDNGDIEKIY